MSLLSPNRLGHAPQQPSPTLAPAAASLAGRRTVALRTTTAVVGGVR